MEVVQDEVNPHLYRVKYDDGKLSDEMYNKTWALEHIRRIEAGESLRPIIVKDSDKKVPSTANRMPPGATEKAVDAFKLKKGITLPDSTQNAPVTL